jgi:hypothetical protein
MKYLPLLALVSFATAAPVQSLLGAEPETEYKPSDPEQWMRCGAQWEEYGAPRVAIEFQGICEERWGQCFLDELRAAGLDPDNWQAWRRDDGVWQADFGIVDGEQVRATAAVRRVANGDSKPKMPFNCWAAKVDA